MRQLEGVRQQIGSVQALAKAQDQRAPFRRVAAEDQRLAELQGGGEFRGPADPAPGLVGPPRRRDRPVERCDDDLRCHGVAQHLGGAFGGELVDTCGLCDEQLVRGRRWSAPDVDSAAEMVDRGALDGIARRLQRLVEQVDGSRGAAGKLPGVGGLQQAPSAIAAARAQRRGAHIRQRGGRVARAPPGGQRRVLQQRRHGLVVGDRGGGQVPRSPLVRMAVAATNQRASERTVRRPAGGRCRPVVDRRAQERMPERDLGTIDRKEPFGLRDFEQRWVTAKLSDGGDDQVCGRGVADRSH